MELVIKGIGKVIVIEELGDYDSYIVITEKGEEIVISKEAIDVFSEK